MATLVAAAGLLVLTWSAVVGPGSLVCGTPWVFDREPPAVTGSPTATAPPGAVATREQLIEDTETVVDLRWLGELLGWVMVVAVLVGAGLLARHLWRHRWHPPEPPESADFEVLPDLHRVAAALARDSAAQLEAVADGSPRDGIQRCWLRVEESVAEAGVRREPWETTAELTVRVLKLLDLDPRAIGRLADLYREARFSRHELGEPERTAARSALHRLHSDLAELEGPRR